MLVMLSEFYDFEHAHSFPVFGPIGCRAQHLLDLCRSQETLRLVPLETALELIGSTQTLKEGQAERVSTARTAPALFEDLNDFLFAVFVQQVIDFRNHLWFCLA